MFIKTVAVGSPDGYVYDIDAEFGPVFHNPVNAGDNMWNHSFSVFIENFDGNDAGFRGHPPIGAPAAHAVSRRDSCDMRPVAVVIVGSGFAVYCIVPPIDSIAKVWMPGNSTVKNGDTGTFPINSMSVNLVRVHDFPYTVHSYLIPAFFAITSYFYHMQGHAFRERLSL